MLQLSSLPPSRKQLASNLKGNWFVPVCGALFVCTSLRTISAAALVCVAVSFVTLLAVALLTRPILPQVMEGSVRAKVFRLVTALGIGLSNYDCCSRKWTESPKLAGLLARLPFGDSPWVATALYIVLLALSLPFVYAGLSLFGQSLRAVLKRHRVFSELSRAERITYAVLFAAVCLLTALVYLNTNAFSVPEPNYNIIYTSDSPFLVKNNVYTHLFHQENDLRQPLFAVFAAPFTGAAYLAGRLLSVFEPSPGLMPALLTNFAQIALLIASCIIMSKLLRLTQVERIGFCMLFASTYTFILAPLMMEQYVVAFFWLMLSLLCAANKPSGEQSDIDSTEGFVLIGAAGTLLTSVLCTPLAGRRSPLRELKQWFLKMLRVAGGFILFVLAFGRLDIFFDLTASLGGFTRYDGEAITFADKLRQYSVFLRNLFIRPEAGLSGGEFPSWQLAPAESFSVFGIVVFVLAALGVLLCRDQFGARLAGCWAAFSPVVLVLLGWGTAENGLILYSLYFGWAFFLLIFGLLQRLCERLQRPILLPVLCGVGVIALWVLNLPALRELIDFATTYYPI